MVWDLDPNNMSMEITGLSMAARAQVVVDPAEGEKALRMLMLKYPQQDSLPRQCRPRRNVPIFRLTPIRASHHTDLVAC